MTKYQNITILVFLAVGLLFVVTTYPALLSNDNQFVKDFFDEDLLSFLGIVLTLSVGFLAQMFLSASRLKDMIGQEGVDEIRAELKSSATFLIVIFFICFALILIKGTLMDDSIHALIVNATLLFFIVAYLLILSDVIMSVFDFDV